MEKLLVSFKLTIYLIERVISSHILKHIADFDHTSVVTAQELLCYMFIMILLPWLEREMGNMWF